MAKKLPFYRKYTDSFSDNEKHQRAYMDFSPLKNPCSGNSIFSYKMASFHSKENRMI